MNSDAERIIGLYQRHAESFDRERGRDLGCGSAEPIARYFIEKGCNLTGVDSSPALIGICKSRFPDQEWIVNDMRTLSLDRRFDGIRAWNSIFHLRP